MINVELYNETKHLERITQMKLREADRKELLASTGLPTDLGLHSSVAASDIVCYTYLDQDKIIAVSGAAHTPLASFALVWAMGTDEVLKHWDEVEPLFTKHVNAVLDEPGVEVIGNVIDLRNEAHIRWITKLGFRLTGDTTKLGGYDFETFYKEER